MLGLFSKSKEIQSFAVGLAEKLGKRYPASIDVNPEKRVSENRLTRVLEETVADALAFQRNRSLGLLGKAKLGNEFRWKLKEMGYSSQFVDVATEAVTISVARGAAPIAPGSEGDGPGSAKS